MGKTAFLFAGQGSQYPGMGSSFYRSDANVKKMFDLFEEIKPGILDTMFNGDEEKLSLTVNTQPATFMTDIAAAKLLTDRGIVPDMVAGFSLGELAAVTFSGIMSMTEGFSLVCKRGELMNEDAMRMAGGMAAILRMEDSFVEELCREFKVYPVNYNCPGQLVVSGEKEKLDGMLSRLDELKVRYVRLPVSGAFHTPFMNNASKKLYEYLKGDDVSILKPLIPVYSDIDATLYESERESIVNRISFQVISSVRFKEILVDMHKKGVDTFVECGPGKTLGGFVRKTLKDVKVLSVSDMESLEESVKELENIC